MPISAELYYHLYEGGEEGAKPPVVLIHGAGGTHLYWPSELRRLPGQRVYALDLPGHGKSGGRGQQSIHGYAQTILEWMEATRLHSAVFVGHSMGSAIALTMALDFPQHVLGLGLLGAGARLRVNPTFLEGSASPTTFLQAVDTAVKWSFGPQTDPRLVELATKRMAETRPSVLHGDFIACNEFDVSDRVSEILQPTLVICGSEDKMVPLRHSQYLATAMPKARLEIISSAGHMVMLEQPQGVAQALLNFLDSVRFP